MAIKIYLFPLLFLLVSCQTTNSDSVELAGMLSREISDSTRARSTRFYNHAKKIFHIANEPSSSLNGHLSSKKMSARDLSRLESDLNEILSEIIKEAAELQKAQYVTAITFPGKLKDIKIVVEDNNSLAVRVSRGTGTIYLPTAYLRNLLRFVISMESDELISPEDSLDEGVFGLLISSMLNEATLMSLGISYEDALRFTIAHEFTHIWLDSRIEPGSLKDEIRADAMGFLLTAQTSNSYLLQKKMYDLVSKTGQGGSSNLYVLALMTAENGANLLFESLQHIGVTADTKHLSPSERIQQADLLFDEFIEREDAQKLEVFQWAVNNKLFTH